ncbi:HD-GYP domain-containing protein [Solibacillus silvestris]|uniref:HD-GYP domain-containing protein n=1 Tax=Solibacillus silvestris TaxID=76853 RepID=UPI003F822E0D
MKQHTTKDYDICLPYQLKPGQILYEDLNIDNRRLLSKGHMLTDGIITILKNRNVRDIKIEKAIPAGHSVNTRLDIDQQIEMELQQLEKMLASPFTPIQAEQELGQDIELDFSFWNMLDHDFLNVLGKLSSEKRYGKALNNSEDIQILKELFAVFLESTEIYNYLSELKSHDETSYLHAIDVFTLGTLFALSEGVSNIKEVALGYLLHDIGKTSIPSSLLNKVELLEHNEFATIQEHVLLGYERLCQDGFEYIAHYAKSHHERIDGSGYPEKLMGDEISLELQILQMIDVYSAMTMDRPYKEAISSVAAIEKLFKQTTQFDLHLIYRLIDFLGIYPENAIVLLSDGNQAIVEKVNPLHPLLPMIKILQTNEQLTMPTDLSLSIKRILTFYIATAEELFVKFSDFLINNDSHSMIGYYNKLKEHYSKKEWFTHIYLPVFHIYRVIEKNNIVSEKQLNDMKNQLHALLENTLKQFRQENHLNEKVVILFAGEKPKSVVRIFEGLLHSSRLYPFITQNQQPKATIEKVISICKAKQVIVVGGTFKYTLSPDIDYYHLSEQQLEILLSRYMYTDIEQFKLPHELNRYYKSGGDLNEIMKMPPITEINFFDTLD